MRPDDTCNTGEINDRSTTLIGSTPTRTIPCGHYSYSPGGPPSTRHNCTIFDDLVNLWKDSNPARDLITNGIYNKDELRVYFYQCHFLEVTGKVYDGVECIQCGECCRYWAKHMYRTDMTRPAQPPNWKGSGSEENPCTQLSGPDGEDKYSCDLYPNLPVNCDTYPSGDEIDLFEQWLDSTTPSGPDLTAITSTPSCPFTFGRRGS